MVRTIPVPVIAVVADVLAMKYTHSRIDYFMEQAGIEATSPPGNKVDKTRAWLKLANQLTPDPLATLGKAIIEFMEVNSSGYASNADLNPERERVNRVLREHGLNYLKGGKVVATGVSAVSQDIEEVIRTRNLSGLQTEFDRIYSNTESDPAAAVTAACALLESLFKVYILDEKLDMPSDKTIKPLWNIVRRDLKLGPDKQQNEDVRTVLVGLGSIVEGLGSLRTHKGSAHGHEKHVYKMEPRHARLTSHAAFTLTSFIFETWEARGA
jgi:Abortive infection C-terminus